ncbi:MAG: hypothetical protein H7293_16235 [Candidatus Saccharibacteria bacterium]|nr:hypothetical protein [Rhodoferax sp.]
MRMLLGVVSLLIALAVVGLLVKKQVTVAVPSAAVVPGTPPAPGASAQVQPQLTQVPGQVKATVDAALQQKRPGLDDN